uniref:Uncharacterized protein n=1 Tax=Trichuris muris TaxID=70415 RepID=A0A5S6QA95_TRIMR
MPRRSRSVRSLQAPVGPPNVSSLGSNDGTEASSELHRVCDWLSNLTEKLDRVVLSLSQNTTNVGQPVSQNPVEQAANEEVQCSESEEKMSSSRYASQQVDKSWFSLESPPAMTGTVQGVNPWLQKLVPAASIEVFDGDPKGWLRFIAVFKSKVHDALLSDADR